MAKPKSRIRRLAESLEQLQRTQDALQAIDLRSCKGPLREHVKNARANVAAAIVATEAAMHSDLPEVPKVSA